MSLLDIDTSSAQISFYEFKRSDELVNMLLLSNLQHTEEFYNAVYSRLHHAKTFVTAVRRVGRIGEYISSKKSVFIYADAAAEVKLNWRKKKGFFESYVDARNAIEHIDGNYPDEAIGKWKLLELDGDILKVSQVEGQHAEVSDKALDSVIDFRNEFVEVMSRYFPRS